MTINNRIVISVINISQKCQIRKTMKNMYQMQKILQIRKQRKDVYQNYYKKIYQSGFTDLNKYGILSFQYGYATIVKKKS